MGKKREGRGGRGAPWYVLPTNIYAHALTPSYIHVYLSTFLESFSLSFNTDGGRASGQVALCVFCDCCLRPTNSLLRSYGI